MTAALTEYNIGDDIVLQATFANRNGVATNPTTVACRVRQPDNTIVSVTATNTGTTGVYEGTFSPSQPGTHYYRFEGTGTIKAAAENPFFVAEQLVPAT